MNCNEEFVIKAVGKLTLDLKVRTKDKNNFTIFNVKIKYQSC